MGMDIGVIHQLEFWEDVKQPLTTSSVIEWENFPVFDKAPFNE
jgi:hypothetical protein